MIRKAAVIIALVATVVSGSNVNTPSCVVSGSDVIISFENDNAKEGDWIGLLPESVVGSQIPDPHVNNWIWTCGSQNCTSSPGLGQVTISAPNLSGTSTWVAVLARFDEDSTSHEMIATSVAFDVRTRCDDKTSAETSRSLASTTVRTDKTSYSAGAPIIVTFSIADTIAGDWVGIFDAGTSIANQDTANFWLWAGCDRQGSLGSCQSKSTGSLAFRDGKSISWKSSWPLAPGRYVAAILRNSDNPPFSPIATSSAFQILVPPISSALIKLVRQDIANLIDDDIKLAAQFLRLGFHDSVGGPDGCVDLTNPDNKGLDVPINALAPIVTKYKASLSRADVWVLATLVGSEVSQPRNADFKVDFAFTEFGRVDCEKQQSVCRNEAGVSHGCSATRGPHRVLPGANTNSRDLFAFFSNNFGFSQRETVAILGAHTIGVLNRKNSGVDGQNGWVVENRILDNGYYVELVGPSGNLVQGAPNWKRHFEDNSDLSQIDDLNVWRGLHPDLNGGHIIMLDSDIAIVRDLNGNNMNSKTGKVSCQFVNRSGNDPTCPQLSGGLQEAARYKFSNRAWLIDFENVLRKMSNRGYTITSNCIGSLCKLAKK